MNNLAEEWFANDLNLNLKAVEIPHYIAIEGPIGVGKTTLAKRLAATFNYDTLLEQVEENPFLERFYQDRRSNALPTQLHFLFQRIKQLQALRQGDMFHPVQVSDFLLSKDPLFAEATLDNDEFRLYQTVYNSMVIDLPKPDLVIYLQAPSDVLLARVQSRGIAMERTIDQDYLEQLNDAYTRFFYYYDETPLLIVNAADINLAEGNHDYQKLVETLLQAGPGRHYYNPQPNL